MYSYGCAYSYSFTSFPTIAIASLFLSAATVCLVFFIEKNGQKWSYLDEKEEKEKGKKWCEEEERR